MQLQYINYKNLSLFFILFLLTIFTFSYSIDIKIPYPDFIIYMINEPIYRFSFYMLIFCISYINPIISLYLMIIILFINIDYINIIKQK